MKKYFSFVIILLLIFPYFILAQDELDKIKILFFAANPSETSRLGLDDEIRSITDKIRASEYRDRLELISVWAVRPDDLLQALNEYKPNIVHFSGHGSSTGEIILVDNDGTPKPVSQKALQSLFNTMKGNIQVVVLNACYSKIQAEAITDQIHCTIGMNSSISDKAAITFAASFYRAIGFGTNIKEAFDQGITALLLEGIPEEDVPQLLNRKNIDPSEVFLLRSTGNDRNDCNMLVIDDVIIRESLNNIEMDIRLRNRGVKVINITKTNLHILSRTPLMGAYVPSAYYNLLVEGEDNFVPVAHILKSQEVDNFVLSVGFSEYNTSCGFVGELILHYNGNCKAVSKQLSFASSF